MGNYILEGVIDAITEADNRMFLVAFTNGNHITVDGQTILNAVSRISGAKRKGGSLASLATSTLKGKRFALVIE